MDIQLKKQTKKVRATFRTTAELEPEMLKTLQLLCKQHNLKMKSLVDEFLKTGIKEFESGLQNDSDQRRNKSEASHKDES